VGHGHRESHFEMEGAYTYIAQVLSSTVSPDLDFLSDLCETPTIRHFACSNGLETFSLAYPAVDKLSRTGIAQQLLTSHMPRANAYVTSTSVVHTPSHTTQRNTSARERRRPIMTNATASSSRPPNSNATQQPSSTAQAQSQAAASTFTAPPVIANIAPSTNPHVIIKHAGRWTRFWLFICCASSEYTDGQH
jgi:hypothetical protein